jgi:hypothetical protein
MPAISPTPDWQWCLPSRRQQAGVSSTAAAMANGSTAEQPITSNTKMERNRRILKAT